MRTLDILSKSWFWFDYSNMDNQRFRGESSGDWRGFFGLEFRLNLTGELSPRAH